MPNASVLEKKQQQVAELAEKISGAVTGVVVDYKGITVADDTALRKELRENGVEYFVVKNTILSRAIEGTSVEGMKSVLEGTTALALSKEDYTAAARILCKFAEGNDNFKVKSGSRHCYHRISCKASHKGSSSCNRLQRVPGSYRSLCTRIAGNRR